MMISLSIALASVCAWGLAPGAPGSSTVSLHEEGGEGPQEELVLATYDLRTVLPRVDARNWSQSMMLPPAGRGVHLLPSFGREGEPYEDSSADVVMKIISRALEDEFLERGRDLSLQDDQHLLLLAPRSTHDKVAGVVGALRGMASDSALLRVDILSSSSAGGALPGNNVVPAEEVDRMISRAGSDVEHRSFEVQLEAGRTTRLDQGEAIRFLFDYDVEIAQGSLVFDPVVLQTRQGLRLLLRAAPAGGGLALGCFLQWSQVDEEENHLIRLAGMVNREDKGMAMIDGPQVLQNPSVLVHGFSANTFLPEGKALLFASETVLAGKTHRQVIALRHERGGLAPYVSHPIPGTGRKLIAVNTELFRHPVLEVFDGPYLPRPGDHPLMTARMLAEPSHFFLGWMRNFAVWDRLGPWVLIVTDRSWDGDNEKKLEALVRSQQVSPKLSSLDVRLQTAGGDLPVRCSLPVRLGSQAGLVVGRTRTVLSDLDVEVAQFAGALDAVMLSTFDGIALDMSVLPGNGNERVLVTDGVAHLVRVPAEEINLQGSLLVRLELPRYDMLELDERRTLRASDGASRVKLGQASTNGLVLDVTVR